MGWRLGALRSLLLPEMQGQGMEQLPLAGVLVLLMGHWEAGEQEVQVTLQGSQLALHQSTGQVELGL
jgi:hypothetical protein